jgi:hypothetical protein
MGYARFSANKISRALWPHEGARPGPARAFPGLRKGVIVHRTSLVCILNFRNRLSARTAITIGASRFVERCAVWILLACTWASSRRNQGSYPPGMTTALLPARITALRLIAPLPRARLGDRRRQNAGLGIE